MHSRLTVYDRLFPGASLGEVIATLARAGAPRAGLARGRIERSTTGDGPAELAAAGVDVTHLLAGPFFPLEEPDGWDTAQASAIETLDLAARVGARCVYGLTGPALGLAWDDAAEAFAAAAAPVAEHAADIGVPLLIEPANMLFADLGFVHAFRDTVDVARAAGLGVCLDFQHCWDERGLRETMRGAADVIGLVQVSDWIPGRREPYRAVPGDGAIPLERLLGAVLEDGYTGYVDLELYGEPDVDPAETIARAADHVGTILERLGA